MIRIRSMICRISPSVYSYMRIMLASTPSVKLVKSTQVPPPDQSHSPHTRAHHPPHFLSPHTYIQRIGGMSRRPSTFLGRDPFKLSTSSSPSPSSQSSTTKSSSSSSAPSPPPPHQRTPRRPTYIPPPRDLPKSTHPSLRHHKISAQPFTLATIPQSQHEKIPTLLPTLPPLLFRQGPTHTQCPRTGVYNVDPYLQKITPREEFDFDTLPVFRPPSKDEALRKIAKKHGGKYTVSTSSITGALGQIYRMITGCKKISVAGLSEEFLSLVRPSFYSNCGATKDSELKLIRAGTSTIPQRCRSC